MLVTSTFAALVTAAVVAAQTTTNARVDLLTNVRPELGFAAYTPEDKVLVAQQAQELLSIYVNQESKIQQYGVDAQAGIAAIVPTVGNMTDKEFHYTLAKHFLSLRDFHTNYYIPGQHSCFSFMTPYLFDFVQSNDIVNEPTVAVRFVAQDATFRKLVPKDALDVKPGDLLVSVNGKTFREHWVQTQNMTGGANQFGGYRAALRLLTSMSGGTHPVPESDQVNFVFKQANGSLYNVTVPYIAVADRDCLADAPGGGSGGGPKGGTSFAPPPTRPSKRPKFNPKLPLAIMPDLGDNEIAGIVFPDDYANYNLRATASGIVKWTIYNNNNANLGFIRLASFTEVDVEPKVAVNAIRDLLVNELKDTAGLVIDVRGNGGGYIVTADTIPQFFVADYEPTTARALISDNNEQIFVEKGAEGQDWKATYLTANPGDKYTGTVSFTSKETANKIGQLYLKPVAVFNNAKCYSACDMFSAGMQDHEAALIIGEDATTGAGGANVIEHRSYLEEVLPEVYLPLPYQKPGEPLRYGAPDMRIAWRQSVRVKKNAGKLIEDIGIISDTVVRPVPSDFAEAEKGVLTQLDVIAQKLQQYGAATGKRGLYFQSPLNAQRLTPASQLRFRYDSQYIRYLELRNATDVVVGTSVPYPFSVRSTGYLNDTQTATALGNFKYTIVGYGNDNNQVLKTNRVLSVVPDASQFLNITTGTNYTYRTSESLAFSGVYNTDTAPENGWIVQNNTITVGNGVQYADDVETLFTIFTNIATGTNATLTTSYSCQTETGSDYLTVFARAVDANGGGEEKELLKVSGADNQAKTVSLAGLTGNVEIGFRFSSDSGRSDLGVTVQTISIAA
ncbi:uncharacterized protein SPPG_05166 [Spizellomyces punctatus DAOM BR117]|uniref:Tail specific protease domain-containing protein n=1 Tax=Spizellomyces punctatus (strain DAOM BR117) TaxID=645134 RepID=A0A0L0HFT7_SPIPD|nr:uncharacterized protein SPPG_05166 [Spizellomyces punctatus DAOM BR117]KNC99789.1 hypothetical protein SPPG_05166 [Spizellomyces punctatus DAOM BR117]|eukprot:XP_016607829.1 hypothetical protein SPPG_05166 [Spizellomyces punctatus DAOM BR117]